MDNRLVPNEIKRWNWGAFSFSFIWGIGNKAYLSLLTLIPGFNIIWIFVCGFKGNEWAWSAGDYDSVEEFMKVQDTWNRAGIVSFILGIIGAIAVIMFTILIAAVAANATYY